MFWCVSQGRLPGPFEIIVRVPGAADATINTEPTLAPFLPRAIARLWAAS